MRKLLMTTMMAILATPALAAQWKVDPTTSKLMFEGEQSGEKFEGSFPKFSSTIDLDEAKPEAASIHIVVTMSNVMADSKDRQDALPTDDWFGVKKFPVAEFTSTSVKKIAEHQFVAMGKLNLHGVTKEVTVPFTLKTVAKSTTATGDFTISRKDFGIGQGRWADDQWIKYPVKISYEIHAIEQ